MPHPTTPDPNAGAEPPEHLTPDERRLWEFIEPLSRYRMGANLNVFEVRTVLALLSEVARMRAALQLFADRDNWCAWEWDREEIDPMALARAALARPADGEKQEKP